MAITEGHPPMAPSGSTKPKKTRVVKRPPASRASARLRHQTIRSTLPAVIKATDESGQLDSPSQFSLLIEPCSPVLCTGPSLQADASLNQPDILHIEPTRTIQSITHFRPSSSDPALIDAQHLPSHGSLSLPTTTLQANLGPPPPPASHRHAHTDDMLPLGAQQDLVSQPKKPQPTPVSANGDGIEPPLERKRKSKTVDKSTADAVPGSSCLITIPSVSKHKAKAQTAGPVVLDVAKGSPSMAAPHAIPPLPTSKVRSKKAGGPPKGKLAAPAKARGSASKFKGKGKHTVVNEPPPEENAIGKRV